MKTVTVRAKFKGELISGEHVLVRSDADTFVIRHPSHGLIKLPIAAAVNGVTRDENTTVLSYDEVVEDINSRFDVLNRLVDGVVSQSIRSLIVSGAPGVGKTYSIDTKLRNAAKNEAVGKYTSNRGTISPIGLYILLYGHKNPGDVLVIDDCDTVFEQLDALNILKAALDTGEYRYISYAKEAYALTERQIPSRFEFKGSVIFVSNIDFDGVIASGGKMAPHVNALMSRSLYVDLGLHSRQALLARVESVCRDSDMLRKRGLSEEEIGMVVAWIKDNAGSLRSLCLRTADQLARLVKVGGNWRLDAKVTLLKPKKV